MLIILIWSILNDFIFYNRGSVSRSNYHVSTLARLSMCLFDCKQSLTCVINLIMDYCGIYILQYLDLIYHKYKFLFQKLK